MQAGVHDAFVGKLAARGRGTPGGSWPRPTGTADRTDDQRPRDREDRAPRRGRGGLARGATAARACAGRATRRPGDYYAPTVLVGAQAAMECSCEETFGPVVPVTRFHDEADVVREANATPFGLASYFYSRDIARVWRVARVGSSASRRRAGRRIRAVRRRQGIRLRPKARATGFDDYMHQVSVPGAAGLIRAWRF
ncbi:MAG: aldehyde dehydrogenase family protein [Betaproteobacteria bacterium]|nr:aldehyde dehydrogenase family protein [Betaproteobacteria bacterium]